MEKSGNVHCLKSKGLWSFRMQICGLAILPSCIWLSAHARQFSQVGILPVAIQACCQEKPMVVDTYQLYSKSAELFLVQCAT